MDINRRAKFHGSAINGLAAIPHCHYVYTCEPTTQAIAIEWMRIVPLWYRVKSMCHYVKTRPNAPCDSCCLSINWLQTAGLPVNKYGVCITILVHWEFGGWLALSGYRKFHKTFNNFKIYASKCIWSTPLDAHWNSAQKYEKKVFWPKWRLRYLYTGQAT